MLFGWFTYKTHIIVWIFLALKSCLVLILFNVYTEPYRHVLKESVDPSFFFHLTNFWNVSQIVFCRDFMTIMMHSSLSKVWSVVSETVCRRHADLLASLSRCMNRFSDGTIKQNHFERNYFNNKKQFTLPSAAVLLSPSKCLAFGS